MGHLPVSSGTTVCSRPKLAHYREWIVFPDPEWDNGAFLLQPNTVLTISQSTRGLCTLMLITALGLAPQRPGHVFVYP